MRALLPAPAETPFYDAYRPADPHAPWLRLNMIGSADGAATDRRGRTGDLGGEGDRELFATLRALADVVLVGAATVRIEGYGPHRLRPDLAERRRADGRGRPAPIAIVSGSLDLDYRAPLFAEAAVPTIVLTCATAAAERRAAAEAAGARLLTLGEQQVDVAHALDALRGLGLRHVLCEGGPTLNAELFAAGLVDELCLTVAPQIVGGDGRRIMAPATPPAGLRLTLAAEAGGELFLRYEVTRRGVRTG